MGTAAFCEAAVQKVRYHLHSGCSSRTAQRITAACRLRKKGGGMLWFCVARSAGAAVKAVRERASLPHGFSAFLDPGSVIFAFTNNFVSHTSFVLISVLPPSVARLREDNRSGLPSPLPRVIARSAATRQSHPMLRPRHPERAKRVEGSPRSPQSVIKKNGKE